MHALEAGAGPAVVLLHPEPGDATTFVAVIAELAGDYRVLALDLRGHGASAKPSGDYSVATQASFVLRFLDAARIERAVLGGNSYGAIVALHLAAHAPERVRALVLSGTSAYHDYRLPWKARLLASRVGRLLAPLVTPRAIERGYREQYADPARADLAQVDKICAAFADPVSRRCLWKQAHQLDFAGVETLLSRVTPPVLLAWGRQDRATPLIWAYRLERDLADARLEIIEQCGHYPPIEQSEAYAREMRAFIEALAP
jgi:pimeloyl-ACP methyl ester carboxylesterase